ncbi:MAG: hypothetical protein K2I47_00410, partial [Odoribacter sp.]|nr:hypothetical protein [Odoribacter sp.]
RLADPDNFPKLESDPTTYYVDEIIKAVQWFVNHPEEAKKMGNRANEAVRKEYNWKTTSEGLLKIYKNIEKEIEGESK